MAKKKSAAKRRKLDVDFGPQDQGRSVTSALAEVEADDQRLREAIEQPIARKRANGQKKSAKTRGTQRRRRLQVMSSTEMRKLHERRHQQYAGGRGNSRR